MVIESPARPFVAKTVAILHNRRGRPVKTFLDSFACVCERQARKYAFGKDDNPAMVTESIFAVPLALEALVKGKVGVPRIRGVAPGSPEGLRHVQTRRLRLEDFWTRYDPVKRVAVVRNVRFDDAMHLGGLPCPLVFVCGKSASIEEVASGLVYLPASTSIAACDGGPERNDVFRGVADEV